jgi:pyridinium-3,5-bisthiocarboxylic acid mononucleotide nickel chelatase
MTTGWFQCLAGASGDMLLAALIDAGAPLPEVQAAIDAVGVEPVRLTTRPVNRGGIGALKVEVTPPDDPPFSHRTWRDIRTLLESSPLAAPVAERALDAFRLLARAEARVHRVAEDDVEFHEVGALDAIADIVGTSAAVEALGITEIVVSTVTLGYGTHTATAHGPIPIPGPAVVALLAETRAPVTAGAAPREMCTPTGAALLAAMATTWGELPSMVLTTTGVGAGSRNLSELPNVLRVFLGERTTDLRTTEVPNGTGSALLLSTNIDDLDPRLWPGVISRLMMIGASDAWLVPILGKKGRPGHTLNVLIAADDPALLATTRRVVLTETTTLGLRVQRVGKLTADRRMKTVTVAGQSIGVKLGILDGEVTNIQPEYVDVVAAAAALNRPVKAILAEASAAAHADLGDLSAGPAAAATAPTSPH